jgi:hypothetical protein
MHDAVAEGVSINISDPNSGQVEQNRRSVVQARDLPRLLPLASMIHREWWLAYWGLCDALWMLILGFGCDRGPAGGPGGRGFHGSQFSFLDRWNGLVLVTVVG